MKKLGFATMIAVFLLLYTNGIQAQTPQTQPNQVVIGTGSGLIIQIINMGINKL